MRWLTVVLALGAGSLAAQQPDTTPGTLQEAVVSATDPTQRFAFFFPTGYDSTRSWPVLFAMDPRARALSPLRAPAGRRRTGTATSSSAVTAPRVIRLPTPTRRHSPRCTPRPGAGSGWIRVASTWWDSRERRGTHGPSRTGIMGHAAGILGAGAGLPSKWALPDPPTGGPAPVFFGTVGNSDFNYEEVIGIDSVLDRTSVRHHVAVFSGPHSWPPDALMLEGVEWFDLQAMRTGLKPADAGVDRLALRGAARGGAGPGGGRRLVRGVAALSPDRGRLRRAARDVGCGGAGGAASAHISRCRRRSSSSAGMSAGRASTSPRCGSMSRR